MAALIYEDDELEAFWMPGTSAFALISFGDLVSLANGESFSVEKPAAKGNLACLGIMAKRPNWYPVRNLQTMWQAVQNFLQPYNERVLYGSSMGAHGAIKSSNLMGASITIALCPQWSINPNDRLGTSLGWEEYYNAEIMNCMKISARDISGSIYILSDPAEVRDEFHRSAIASLHDQVVSVSTHYCDHNVTPVLSGSKHFLDIIELCRSHQMVDLKQLINRLRRPHFFRKKAVIERALIKKPALIVDICLRQMDHDPLVKEIVKSLGHKFQAATQTYAKNGTENQYTLRLIDAASDIFEKFRLSLLLAKEAEVDFCLFTIFGTRVFYDVMENKLVHAGAEDGNKLLASVKLYLHNDKIELYIKNRLCRISLPQSEDLAMMQAQVPFFEPIAIDGGRVALRRDKMFLSADPRGFLTCDRTSASDWEYFTIDIER